MKKPRSLLSPIAPTITLYLLLKKALGRQYRNETNILEHLDQFLASEEQHASTLTAAGFSA